MRIEGSLKMSLQLRTGRETAADQITPPGLVNADIRAGVIFTR
jgi:hypothetical protein